LKKIISGIKNINYKDLVFFALVVLAFFGVLIQRENAIDTYSVFTNNAGDSAAHFIGDGRFITAFFTLVCSKLHLGDNTIYIISTIVAFIALIASLYVFNSIIKEHIKNEWLSRALSVITILNVFIIELLLFIEKGILVTSILLNVIALKYFVNYLKEKKKKNLIITAIILILASGCYQGTLALFVALSTIFIIKYFKNFKEFIINNIWIILGYGIAGIFNLTVSKLTAGTRTSGVIELGKSIEKVFKGSMEMFKTNGIINKTALIVIAVLLAIFIITAIIKSDKKKMISILQLLYIFVATYIIVIAPQFLQNTESIWMVPRSTYAFASIIGIVFIFAFMQLEIKDKGNTALFILIAVILFTAQYVSFSKILTDRYKLNALDKTKAEEIVFDIENYEKQNNKTIDTIVFNTSNIRYTYDGIVAIGDMNVRAFSKDWSTKAILEYFSDRVFIITNEKIENYENNIEFKENKIYINNI
jgi:hypothetical protein